MDFSVAIVGAGKVGFALARAWHQAGVNIRTVYSRTLADAQSLASKVDARAVERLDELEGDLIVLCVPDGQIQTVAAELQGRSSVQIVHTSGANGADLFVPYFKPEQVGSFHPAFPFTTPTDEIVSLAGVSFAVEAEDVVLQQRLNVLVDSLNGRVLHINLGKKPLYHAALALVSNYSVVLYATAERILKTVGADQQASDAVLNGLLAGTLQNLEQVGVPEALTGPLVRQDLGTVQAHIDALSQFDAGIASAYLELVQLALPVLSARGIPVEPVRTLIEREGEDASHSA